MKELISFGIFPEFICMDGANKTWSELQKDQFFKNLDKNQKFELLLDCGHISKTKIKTLTKKFGIISKSRKEKTVKVIFHHSVVFIYYHKDLAKQNFEK